MLEYSRPLVEEFLTMEITPEAAERAQLEIERPWFARKGAP